MDHRVEGGGSLLWAGCHCQKVKQLAQVATGYLTQAFTQTCCAQRAYVNEPARKFRLLITPCRWGRKRIRVEVLQTVPHVQMV